MLLYAVRVDERKVPVRALSVALGKQLTVSMLQLQLQFHDHRPIRAIESAWLPHTGKKRLSR